MNVVSMPECWGTLSCCRLNPLSPSLGMKKKEHLVRISAGQEAGNVSLPDFLGTCWWFLLLCKHNNMDTAVCCWNVGLGNTLFPLSGKRSWGWKIKENHYNYQQLEHRRPLMTNAPSVHPFTLYVWYWSCILFSSPSLESGCPWPGQQPLPVVFMYLKELASSFVGCQG